jgi:hypothetical protein
MDINVTVNLPPKLEEQLRAESGNLSTAIRDGFALELFRRRLLSRQGLSQMLGLDRFETYALLKHHQIFDGSLTHEDVDADVASARELLGIPRR